MKFKRSIKIKPQRIKSIIPNFITITSLCLGLTSVRLSFEGEFEKAALLILTSGLMDFLDGKTARLLKVKSKLGEFLDSLSDMVSFGVAPMFLIYHFALSSHKKFGWTACLYFSTCMALRLARFNATLSDEKSISDQYFIGVPAPLGACIIMVPLFFFFETDAVFFQNFTLNFLFVWVSGFLMISTIPVFSLKSIHFSYQQVRLILLAGLSLLPFFYTHFYLMLGIIGILSIASIPMSRNYYARKHQI